MNLHWKTNKEYPIPVRDWKLQTKPNANWWNIYVISSKHNFNGLVNYEEEYNDENGDILAEACVSLIDDSIKILWTDIDYWISEKELQTFLLNDINKK